MELLKNYKKYEFELYGNLVRLRDIANAWGDSEKKEEIQVIIDILQKKIFKVAVVGEFKRGKSTLINALLHREVLPADVTPTTATVNRITYGMMPKALVLYKDETQEEIDIQNLSEYVTKLTPEGKARAAGIKETILYYPTHICDNNVDIIDTPGLCDDDEMTMVTMEVIPKIDVAIIAVSAIFPFSETECTFVTNLITSFDKLCNIVFVVTYLDLIDEDDDPERLLNFIKERIGKSVNEKLQQTYGEDTTILHKAEKIIKNAPIYGVSAKQALKAYSQSGNQNLLKASGFKEFELDLSKLLAIYQGLNSIRRPLVTASKLSLEMEQLLETTNPLKSKSDKLEVLCNKLKEDVKTPESLINSIATECEICKKNMEWIINQWNIETQIDALNNNKYSNETILKKYSAYIKEGSIAFIDNVENKLFESYKTSVASTISKLNTIAKTINYETFEPNLMKGQLDVNIDTIPKSPEGYKKYFYTYLYSKINKVISSTTTQIEGVKNWSDNLLKTFIEYESNNVRARLGKDREMLKNIQKEIKDIAKSLAEMEFDSYMGKDERS